VQGNDRHIGEFVAQIPPFPPEVSYTGKAFFHPAMIGLSLDKFV
jgi:hypothetical protein